MAAESEWAYLAGLVDGEGSICIAKPRKSYAGYQLSIRISNTDARMMLWLKDRWQGSITIQQRKSKKHKTGYEWRVYAKDADYILEYILPYLIIKKEQAILAIELRRTIKEKRGGNKIHPSVINYRENLRQEMLKLNKKGKVA